MKEKSVTWINQANLCITVIVTNFSNIVTIFSNIVIIFSNIVTIFSNMFTIFSNIVGLLYKNSLKLVLTVNS